MKSVALTLLKFVLPAVIIAWLLWRVEPQQWQSLRERPTNVPLLVAAWTAALSAVCLSFLRWWILVRCQGIRLGWLDAFRLSAISYLLNFVAAGSVGGDLFKAIFLARKHPGQGVEAFASIVVDRGVGLLALLLTVSAVMAAAGRTTHPELADLGRGAVILSAVGTCILAGLVFGGKTIDRLIHSLRGVRVIGKVVVRIAGPLRVFHRRPVALGVSLLISFIVHLLLAVSIHWLASGLYGEEAPTFGEHLLISPIANLASAMPIAPAGVGVLEAAMEWLYRIVPRRETLASGTLVALTFEIVKVVLAIVGMIFYWTSGAELKRAVKAKIPSESQAET